jgi:hypothetical protein
MDKKKKRKDFIELAMEKAAEEALQENEIVERWRKRPFYIA